MQSRENRYHIGDAMVTSTQPRNQLENGKSQDDKMSTIVWKEYKAKRRKENKERKKSSNSRRGKDCEIGSRWQRRLGKREESYSRP